MRSPIPEIVSASIRRPWLTLGLCLALAALSLLFAMNRFDMTTDTAALISPDV
ncbi:MAG: hypothetical protein JF564_07270, partial [Sphingomonas sp.]|nr:hypothetical protein [Sphingomonas sp.]